MARLAARSLLIMLRLVLAVSVAALGLLVATVQLAPHAERSTFVIRGGSMEPAIPLGSLVVVGPSADYAVGDVVSLRNGEAVVTHRVVGVETIDGQTRLQTRGDANEATDASYAAPSDAIGRVEVSVPFAGFLLAFLGQPIGIIAVLSFLGTLLLGGWFIEDLLAAAKRRPVGRAEEAIPNAAL